MSFVNVAFISLFFSNIFCRLFSVISFVHRMVKVEMVSLGSVHNKFNFTFYFLALFCILASFSFCIASGAKLSFSRVKMV